MKFLRPLPCLLAAHWLSFIAAFAITCRQQGKLLWSLQLNWSSWLSDLAALAKLEAVPAGSLWIIWFLAGLALSAVTFFPNKPTQTLALKPKALEPVMQESLAPISEMANRPDLKEKIQRLNQSLQRL